MTTSQMLAAITAATTVHDANAVRNEAMILIASARQSAALALVRRGLEIRVRAERRIGELLTEMAARGERRRRGHTKPIPGLGALGVSLGHAHKWQRLGKIPPDEFERRIRALPIVSLKKVLSGSQIVDGNPPILRRPTLRKAPFAMAVAALNGTVGSFVKLDFSDIDPDTSTKVDRAATAAIWALIKYRRMLRAKNGGHTP